MIKVSVSLLQKKDVAIFMIVLFSVSITSFGVRYPIENVNLNGSFDSFLMTNNTPKSSTTVATPLIIDATAIGEDSGTIEEVYEPFLIKEGFIKRTPRGREATELAYKHLGKLPPTSQNKLF